MRHNGVFHDHLNVPLLRFPVKAAPRGGRPRWVGVCSSGSSFSTARNPTPMVCCAGPARPCGDGRGRGGAVRPRSMGLRTVAENGPCPMRQLLRRAWAADPSGRDGSPSRPRAWWAPRASVARASLPVIAFVRHASTCRPPAAGGAARSEPPRHRTRTRRSPRPPGNIQFLVAGFHSHPRVRERAPLRCGRVRSPGQQLDSPSGRINGIATTACCAGDEPGLEENCERV